MSAPSLSERARPDWRPARSLEERFQNVRQLTEALTSSLSDADASGQSMADASPAKWHLAHTTWFFETFVLKRFVNGYKVFDPRFHFLFNSYYEAEGPRLARPSRGMLSRPCLAEILDYRLHVTGSIVSAIDTLPPEAWPLVELGCHHEEQHQELLQTDILHFFSQNPLQPEVWSKQSRPQTRDTGPVQWVEGKTGPTEIGFDGRDDFAFDAEGPRHTVWLPPHTLADRLVTNAEWLEFMQDGGYRRPELWLSDGWAWVRQNSIESPLYWRRDDQDSWSKQFQLDGLNDLVAFEPVTHVSYYEADAFARWSGSRLPTEAEWESAASEMDPSHGNFLDSAGPIRPTAASGSGVRQLFGDVWEWTGSAFLPYPSFKPAAGAVGEYNGKFMSGQFVLRGGSCATPRGHARASYRNFFYPHQRWQFTGVRLAKDL